MPANSGWGSAALECGKTRWHCGIYYSPEKGTFLRLNKLENRKENWDNKKELLIPNYRWGLCFWSFSHFKSFAIPIVFTRLWNKLVYKVMVNDTFNIIDTLREDNEIKKWQECPIKECPSSSRLLFPYDEECQPLSG